MTSVPTSEDVPGEGVETRPGAARFIRATAALGRGPMKSKSSYTRARGTKFLVALVLTIVAAFALSGNALASAGVQCAPTGMETVATDQPSYPVGSVVHIAGTGFAVGCDIVVRVTDPGGSSIDATVTTDISGGFSHDYTIPGPPYATGTYQVDALGAGDAVLAHTEFEDALTLTKLFANGTTIADETYVFTVGDTLNSNAALDPGQFGKVEITRPGGTVHVTSACLPSTSFNPSPPSYTFVSSDPASSDAANQWTYTARQYSDSTCTTLDGSARSINFSFAKAELYADSALTIPKSAFGTGQTAYVKIKGFAPSKANVSTAWLLPNGSVACSIQAGSDKPDSSSTGDMPATSFLQYLPDNAAAALWNKASSYTPACPTFASTNQGQWKLQLNGSGNTNVKVAVFTVDTTAPATPSITGSTPASPANNNSPSINGTAEAGSTVKLYTNNTCTSAVAGSGTATGGNFSIAVSVSDNTSTTFYAAATDAAGNVSGCSSGFAYVEDSIKPSSLASSPQYNNDGTIDVGYTASDTGGSGLKKVELYVKGPSDSSYSLAMTDTAGSGTGINNTFAYQVPEETVGPPAGDYVQGTYRFYTIASDVADNVEDAPANPDATTTQTLQDSIAPSLNVSHTANGSNGWNTSSPVTVTVTASDAGSGLNASSPSCLEGATPLTLTPAGAGSWTISVSGNGTHVIDCQATDNATNQSTAQDTVKIDTLDPSITVSHTANAAGWNNSSPVTVSVAVSDGGSGLAGPPSCTVDAAAATVTGSSSPYSLSVSGEGTHTVSCSVSDNAGRSNSAGDTVKIDLTKPSSLASSPQ